MCSKSNVDLSELMQQLRSTTFCDPSTPGDYQIVIQDARFSACLHRECDTCIFLDIFHFLPGTQMSTNNFITIQTYPHQCDLRTPIRIECHKMDQMPRRQSLPYGVIQNHSYHHPFFIRVFKLGTLPSPLLELGFEMR